MSGKPKKPRRSAPEAGSPTKAPLGQDFARHKLWLFRLSAVVLVPAALLVLIELSLRLFQVGYPTSFLYAERWLAGRYSLKMTGSVGAFSARRWLVPHARSSFR